MTRIQYNELNGGFSLECSGHSGYGAKGEDIVCAGVSALCAALREGIEEAADEGLTDKHLTEESDGFFRITAFAGNDRYAERYLALMFRMVLQGMMAIADSYPENAMVEY